MIMESYMSSVLHYRPDPIVAPTVDQSWLRLIVSLLVGFSNFS